jgi:hypothetical protein
MSADYRTYAREDALGLINSETFGYKVIDQAILDEIRKQPTNTAIKSRATKRGCKGGQRHHGINPYYKCMRESVLTCIPKKKPTKSDNYAALPSILYTNCRSLNEWKLNELAVVVEAHQPTLICLTETWLTAAKEQSRQLPGYEHFFCHRKNRTGGGVAILVADSLPTTVVSSKTTPTYSAIWTISLLDNYGQIITGCIYHPPDAEQSKTMDYISSELSSRQTSRNINQP